MTNNVSKCSYYKAESENVKSRWACDVPKGFLSCNPFKQIREVPDNKEECEVRSPSLQTSFITHYMLRHLNFCPTRMRK